MRVLVQVWVLPVLSSLGKGTSRVEPYPYLTCIGSKNNG